MRRFDDQVVLLNLDTGQYHGLDGIGAEFLDALGEGATVDEAIASLSERFAGVETERLRGDLDAFCDQLAERGLVERQGDGWR